jgi:hypothetical protein
MTRPAKIEELASAMLAVEDMLALIFWALDEGKILPKTYVMANLGELLNNATPEKLHSPAGHLWKSVLEKLSEPQ